MDCEKCTEEETVAYDAHYDMRPGNKWPDFSRVGRSDVLAWQKQVRHGTIILYMFLPCCLAANAWTAYRSF